MASLQIATQANQASTFPVLLIASYAKELDAHISLEFQFDEAATLKPGSEAYMELITKDDQSSVGSDAVVKSLVRLFPVLQITPSVGRPDPYIIFARFKANDGGRFKNGFGEPMPLKMQTSKA